METLGIPWASQVVLVVKNPPANAGDVGSIPGSERSPRIGNGSSSIFAWKVPWTEDPGWLQSMGSERVRPNGAMECVCMHVHTTRARRVRTHTDKVYGD